MVDGLASRQELRRRFEWELWVDSRRLAFSNNSDSQIPGSGQ